MRGANHGHAWYTSQTQVWADMKNSGANTIRVVLTGGRYGYSSPADVSAVISRCKAYKLVCVLENHDTTGYGDQGGAVTLDAAADYWLAVKSALQGQEAYAIINIGNEPLGNNSASQWAGATRAAVQKLRNGGGVEYLDMVYGFNVNNRSWWGDRIIWGTNGWKQTSRQATVYN
ncbi:hypothetical protein GCM10009827_084950 [Dactylosporangium maewongense]|uniref:Glycoside hydrolase family 5 domain-containing protein n=1 Tax=Dactylosporangium maewongense TaxID=634393 RepID=A0ABP4MWA0_9ACTN